MKNNYTANSGIDVSETAMDIKILGKERKFFYPDNEFMKDIIVAALNGARNKEGRNEHFGFH